MIPIGSVVGVDWVPRCLPVLPQVCIPEFLLVRVSPSHQLPLLAAPGPFPSSFYSASLLSRRRQRSAGPLVIVALLPICCWRTAVEKTVATKRTKLHPPGGERDTMLPPWGDEARLPSRSLGSPHAFLYTTHTLHPSLALPCSCLPQLAAFYQICSPA